jgi:hypothetical protein
MGYDGLQKERPTYGVQKERPTLGLRRTAGRESTHGQQRISSVYKISCELFISGALPVILESS